jgi:cyclopropane fatty-acyl-phospholipid synthase-like methyltransferase
MPILSRIAQKKKIKYFLERIPKSAHILEVGCGSGWVGRYFRDNNYSNYVGLDLVPPADVVGDIRNWRKLGLSAGSFDVIVAFEVLEHVDCFDDCYQLLKPGGRLLATSPVPCMDWFMKVLERLGLNQKRTSPHCHLARFQEAPSFEQRDVRIVGGLSQWGVFWKGE